MDLEITLKVIGALGVILGAGKIIYDVSSGVRTRLREEYKFAKDFLRELQQENQENPNLHPFAVEKGYQAIAGSVTISSNEVRYLLSLENPGRCLNDYVSSKRYLQTLKTEGDLQVEFRKTYCSPLSRKMRKIIWLISYVFLSLTAILPILLTGYSTLAVFAFPVVGYYAIAALNEFITIEKAEKLVKNQRKHTKMIVTHS